MPQFFAEVRETLCQSEDDTKGGIPALSKRAAIFEGESPNKAKEFGPHDFLGSHVRDPA